MKHDTKWLADNFYGDQHDGKYDHDSACELASDYAEHVYRWRAIDDQPTDGERIELVDESGYGVVVFPNEVKNPFIELWLMHDAIAWRSSPLGKLPESSDETR